ncbi:ATP-dependent helicase [Bifidobacterium xylocopae]
MSVQDTMRNTPEQAAIIGAEPDDDLLVVAGAGSGKTRTMTNRIVALIGRGVPPESILGLTFTNKAASELLSRVSAAVAAGGGEANGDPNRIFLKPEVRTYDAFFQSIVRQYGLLVGMDQGTRPLSEAGAYQLAADVVKEHLDLIFPRHPDGEPGEGAGTGPEPSADEDQGAFKSTVGEVLALSRACSDAMISRDCPSFEDAVARVRAWDKAFLGHLDALIGTDRVPDRCPSKAKTSLPTKTGGSSGQTLAEQLGDMRLARHGFRLVKADELRRTVLKRERLLTLAERYQEAKREAGMAEFSDFTLAAFQLVTRFPSIGAIYRRRFTHVFLDEYQDTSTTQALLLAALFHPRDTAGGEGGESGSPAGGAAPDQEGPRRSAVTAVGDPFQSIYAWRGASPGAFKTFQREFGMDQAAGRGFGVLDRDPLTLSRTFRNARLILDAANRLTRPLRPADKDSKPASDGPGSSARLREVAVKPLDTRPEADQGTLGLLGYGTLGQEIDGVVRFVRCAVAAHAHPDPQGVDRQAPHAAVLFRSKNAMADYRKALEAAGLSVQVVGRSDLLDRADVTDLMALLRLTCDHTDSASLLRLLASPRFGMSAGDLSALADLAAQLNQESQYRALVQAGLVPDGLSGSDLGRAVRDHRDHLSAGVFLVDVLLGDDLPKLLAGRRASRISPRGRDLLLKAGGVLAQAQAQSSAPLRQAVLAASRALGLDIDLVVAQAMASPAGPIDASAAKAGLGAFLQQVDAYSQELPEGVSASLPGFVAWIDAMGDNSPQEPDSGMGAHADVVLMTIHQAKGLEWDAVVVVGLKKDGFPSGRGDRLKIEPARSADGRDTKDGSMAYESTARTWLEEATAVPVPIRADAAILPRFPHDAPADLSPEESLEGLDLTSLEDEAFGCLRTTTGFVDDAACSISPDGREVEVDRAAVPDYLTQPQEYGRRLHNDERRLAYVALTRARHDLLMTFSVQGADLNPALLAPDADGAAQPGRSGKEPKDPRQTILDKASNFWTELEAEYSGCSEAVTAGEAWRTANHGGDGQGPQSQPERLFPQGCFLGERAGSYEKAVVGQALDQAPRLDRPDSSGQATIWPVELSGRLRRALESAAHSYAGARPRQALPDGGLPEEAAQGSLYAHAVRLMTMGSGRLGVRGDLLVRDSEALKRVGAQVLGRSAQSVTAIQARSGALDDRQERRYWSSVVRPLPRVASPLAQAGTLFHAWAAEFILPRILPDSGALDSMPDGRPVDPYAQAEGPGREEMEDGAGPALAGLTGDQLERRKGLLAELESGQAAMSEGSGPDRPAPLAAPRTAEASGDPSLLVWERRLATSEWAGRDPVWVERPIVAVLAGQIVKGKLDAVFAGGLDPADGSKRYTIVDWKTGHRPRTADERRLKLEQLDLYRLLLSRMENIPLASIDACLYYVSEDDSSQRSIPAEPKSGQAIEDQIRSGLPRWQDDD